MEFNGISQGNTDPVTSDTLSTNTSSINTKNTNNNVENNKSLNKTVSSKNSNGSSLKHSKTLHDTNKLLNHNDFIPPAITHERLPLLVVKMLVFIRNFNLKLFFFLISDYFNYKFRFTNLFFNVFLNAICLNVLMMC